MSQNLLYPGRPNYEGPVQGVFGLLHHDIMVEWSDNVMERVEYVKKVKPKHEVDIRLWNMCYLSEERLPKELVKACKTWEDAGKTFEVIFYTSSPQIFNLIQELVPDTVWNGQELVFPQ